MGLKAKLKRIKLGFQPFIVSIHDSDVAVLERRTVKELVMTPEAQKELVEMRKSIESFREAQKRIEVRVYASCDRFDELVKEALGDVRKPLAQQLREAGGRFAE